MRYESILLFVLVLLSGAVRSETNFFDDAQHAATENRYEDVVAILTEALTTETLEKHDLVIAHSNRGIAHSLLEQYSAAVKDLTYAIELDPLHLLSLNHLGILAEHVEGDYSKAAGWYARGANAGYAASQVNLGNLYRRGHGVERNVMKALQLFELAVAQDYAAALVASGELHMEAGNYVRGIEYLDKGVERGVVTGHHYLGLASQNGWGVPRDFAEAARHYLVAAKEGHAKSQGALGHLYREGYGVDQSLVEAAKWYTFAADQGDLQSANRLAWLLATCPTREVCNGKTALRYANLAVSADRSASNLDSLAAAHARLGEFDLAISLIEELIQDKSIDETARDRYAGRLERYRNGIPFQL